MLRHYFTLPFTLAIIALAVNLVSGEPVGMVVTVRGISHITDDQGQSKKVKMGMAVHQGDLIETDRQANIKILFLDETTLSLAGNSQVVIEQYAFGDGKVPKAVTRIKNGAFRFMAGKMAKEAPENFKIETSTATIGIRGSGGWGSTSDGSFGRARGLKIATVEGHVLEVTTFTGQSFVVDDPAVGLIVDANGQGRVWAIEEEGVLPKQEPFLPLPKRDMQAWFVFSRTHLALRRKKRVFSKIDKGDKKMKKEEPIREQMAARDLEVDREKTSASPMMRKLAQESVKPKKPVVREVETLRESSSSQTVLRRLGIEQMKALDEQFSKMPKQNS